MCERVRVLQIFIKIANSRILLHQRDRPRRRRSTARSPLRRMSVAVQELQHSRSSEIVQHSGKQMRFYCSIGSPTSTTTIGIYGIGVDDGEERAEFVHHVERVCCNESEQKGRGFENCRVHARTRTTDAEDIYCEEK